MPKFSIIIPVYNTEKYLKKCLDSVFNQEYKDFEVIIINDGSTDKSENIINEYINTYNNIKYIKQKNKGLSNARNEGVSKSKGEFLLFLDSDDFYEKEFLSKLNENINDESEVIRYQVQDVLENEKIITYKDEIFTNLNKDKVFDALCKSHYIEIACAYCYNKNFWIRNNFKFLEGTYHEDFGLIPLVLLKSNFVKCIDVIGYNYVIRDNSIMTSNDYNKIVKKANDFLIHFKKLKKESIKITNDLSTFNSYIANSVIIKSTTLKGKDYKKYVKELKKIGTFEMLLEDTITRKIKKKLIKISPKIYYKIVRR